MSRTLKVIPPPVLIELLEPLFGAEVTGVMDAGSVLDLIKGHPGRLDAAGVVTLRDGVALYCRVVSAGGPAPADPRTPEDGGLPEGQIVVALPRGRYLVSIMDATGRTIGLESLEGGPAVCGFPDTGRDLVLAIRRKHTTDTGGL